MSTPSNQPPQGPQLPPGLIYYTSTVEELLKSSVYLDLIVTPRRGSKNVALPLPGSSSPSEITGVQLFGDGQRLTIDTTAGEACLQGVATIGSTLSEVSLRWVLAPDDEYALPDQQPLPTQFDPGKSQRFVMMNFELRLDRDGKSSFLGFGTGRTYPGAAGGDGRTWLGACGRVLSGQGAFANVQASFAINGFITPPDDFFLEVLIRIMDPAPAQPASEPAGSRRVAHPLAGSTYTTFIGEPGAPIQQEPGPDGQVIASVTELLRVVRVEYDLGSDGTSLRARHVTEDWIAGKLTTKIRFNLNDPKTPGTPSSPLPWQTAGTTIAFFDPQGKELGTIGPNIVEGRGFLTQFTGFAGPVLNLVGFGPFAGGTGCFADAQGMLTVNAGITPVPPMLSNLYVVRFKAADTK